MWTAASVLGIVTVLRSSEVAFTVLKLAGAAYLVCLGVTAFLSLRSPPAAAEPAPRPGRGSPFRQGLLSNVFNPKIAISFTSFIPQFVAPDPSAVVESLVLAGIFTGVLYSISNQLFTMVPPDGKVTSDRNGLYFHGPNSRVQFRRQ
ncbi:LysE family translocator [Amycolatopsis magusensis]|uniref:LysE family translocator n=1 Tax=Amycolatopsis magusensis TaxID=882444 RepID=UPI0027E166EF|nr:LysE family translocator [Amycolatopsis magusensis]